jgi:hypothetical protein
VPSAGRSIDTSLGNAELLLQDLGDSDPKPSSCATAPRFERCRSPQLDAVNA